MRNLAAHLVGLLDVPVRWTRGQQHDRHVALANGGQVDLFWRESVRSHVHLRSTARLKAFSSCLLPLSCHTI